MTKRINRQTLEQCRLHFIIHVMWCCVQALFTIGIKSSPRDTDWRILFFALFLLSSFLFVSFTTLSRSKCVCVWVFLNNISSWLTICYGMHSKSWYSLYHLICALRILHLLTHSYTQMHTNTTHSLYILSYVTTTHINIYSVSLCVHMLAEHLFTQFTDPNARFKQKKMSKIKTSTNVYIHVQWTYTHIYMHT